MDLIYFIDLFEFFFISIYLLDMGRGRERSSLALFLSKVMYSSSSTVVHDNTKYTIMEVRYKSTRYTYKERDKDSHLLILKTNVYSS